MLQTGEEVSPLPVETVIPAKNMFYRKRVYFQIRPVNAHH